jgi:hypothetical protein
MDTRTPKDPKSWAPLGILPIPERAIGGQRLRIKAQDFKRGVLQPDCSAKDRKLIILQ